MGWTFWSSSLTEFHAGTPWRTLFQGRLQWKSASSLPSHEDWVILRGGRWSPWRLQPVVEAHHGSRHFEEPAWSWPLGLEQAVNHSDCCLNSCSALDFCYLFIVKRCSLGLAIKALGWSELGHWQLNCLDGRSSVHCLRSWPLSLPCWECWHEMVMASPRSSSCCSFPPETLHLLCWERNLPLRWYRSCPLANEEISTLLKASASKAERVILKECT